MSACRLADVDDLRLTAGERENLRTHEPVGEYHVGPLQGAQRTQCHEFRIAGACADQRDESPRRRLVGLERLAEEAIRFVLTSRAHLLSDDAVEQPFI